MSDQPTCSTNLGHYKDLHRFKAGDAVFQRGQAATVMYREPRSIEKRFDSAHDLRAA
jgi:hypothetical protein